MKGGKGSKGSKMRVKYKNGAIYEGDFKDGLPNGKGTFIFANGNKYVGELKDDKFNGQGTFTLASGAQYAGGLAVGRPEPGHADAHRGR